MSVNTELLQALIYRIRELIEEMKSKKNLDEQLLETQKQILEVQLKIYSKLK